MDMEDKFELWASSRAKFQDAVDEERLAILKDTDENFGTFLGMLGLQGQEHLKESRKEGHQATVDNSMLELLTTRLRNSCNVAHQLGDAAALFPAVGAADCGLLYTSLEASLSTMTTCLREGPTLAGVEALRVFARDTLHSFREEIRGDDIVYSDH